MRGETRRKARRRYPADEALRRVSPRRRRERRRRERESGRATEHRAELDQRCQARSRSGPQRGGTLENETSSAGLRPEDVYVYVERSQGRANRPFLEGEHRCPDRDRTLEGKPALHIKTIEPRKHQAIPADGIGGGCRRSEPRQRACRPGWCQCPRGREVPESRGCPRRAGACERQSSA